MSESTMHSHYTSEPDNIKRRFLLSAWRLSLSLAIVNEEE
jgi:hypothetical protein